MNAALILQATLVIATSLALTACTHADSIQKTHEPLDATKTLTAYHWLFTKAVNPNGDDDMQWQQAQKQETPVSLVFSDDGVGVTGLCNRMGAEYRLNNSKITISNMISTQMYCSDKALMDLEQSIGGYLPNAVTWQIEQTADAPNLILRFDDKSQWILQGEATAETKYGHAAEIIFLEVAPQTKPCLHPLLGDSLCLQTRTIEYNEQGLKQSQGDWQNLYQTIEDYKHTPGVRNILRLKRYQDKNATDEISKYVYILDMVVESEQLN